MKNTNTKSGSVSAAATKETNLKVFSNKDVAEMSIKMIEDLLDTEKGPVRSYRDEDLKNRAKVFLSEEYQSNSFEMKIDRKKGIVWAVPTSNKKETIENDFKNGKEVDSREYWSLFEKDGYKRLPAPTNAFNKALEYDWTFHATNEDDFVITALDPGGWQPILAKTDRFLAEHICKTHNDWRNFKTKNGKKKIKKGNLRRLKNLAWRMKTFRNAFKLIEKNKYLGFDSIRIWIEENEDDVNQWIFTKWLKNSSNYEDFMWYFNDKNESYFNGSTPDEYEDMQDSLVFIDYFDLTLSTRTVIGIPEGEWDSYTFHQEYESKLFADGKDFTVALVLEKMFEFAEEYVKHNGWITGEMADKYHIDLKLVETNSDSDVLLDKMDPATANCVRKIVEDDESSNPKEKMLNRGVPCHEIVSTLRRIVNNCEAFLRLKKIYPVKCGEMNVYIDEIYREARKTLHDLGYEAYSTVPKDLEYDVIYMPTEDGTPNGKPVEPEPCALVNSREKEQDQIALLENKLITKKNLEQRVDNLEKMVKDIWTNVCADKSPAETEDNLPMEIINKKPVLGGRQCPRCKNSKDGCEFYDKGTCRGVCYPTYPPQYDPCVFEK